MAGCIKGRASRGQLFALKGRSLELASVKSLTPELRNNLEFHKALLARCPWRTIDLAARDRVQTLLYTDASCEPSEGAFPLVKLCWMIFHQGRSFGGVCTVPDRVLASFATKKQYIAQGEALAPLLALHFHPEPFRGASMLCFIDNMAVLSGLTVGTSRVADLGTILHATALHLVNLNCQAWWEHVDSAANPADGGSRVGVCCEIAKLLGTELREYEFPAWPSDVINAKPEVWLRLLEETKRPQFVFRLEISVHKRRERMKVPSSMDV